MLAQLILAAAFSGQLEISDRTEFRIRDPGSVADTASIDLETALTTRLTLASRRTRFTFSYNPRLTLWDLNVAPSLPALMQEGGARAEWHDRFMRWWVDQLGSYGSVNLTSMSFVPGTSGEPPRIDAVPTSQVIQYESSTSTLGMHLTLRKCSFEWLVGYQLAGGADAVARAVLPMERGPFAEGTFDVHASRRTRFITRASGAEAEFSSGPETALVQATEAWRYAWTRSIDTEISAGVAEARDRPGADLRATYAAYPVADAMLEKRWGHRENGVTVRFTARIAPMVNRLLGTVDERVQALILATWTRQRFVMNVFATAQQTVPTDDPSAVQLLAGEVNASYAPSARSLVAFDLGVRTMAQRLNTPVAPGSSGFLESSFVQGIFFVGFSLRAHPTRF